MKTHSFPMNKAVATQCSQSNTRIYMGEFIAIFIVIDIIVCSGRTVLGYMSCCHSRHRLKKVSLKICLNDMNIITYRSMSRRTPNFHEVSQQLSFLCQFPCCPSIIFEFTHIPIKQPLHYFSFPKYHRNPSI